LIHFYKRLIVSPCSCMHLIMTPCTVTRQKKALEEKAKVSNPISRLIESGQAIHHPVTFSSVTNTMWKVVWGEVVVKGEGVNKKEAKISAAKNMIKHIQGNKSSEISTKNTEVDIVVTKDIDIKKNESPSEAALVVPDGNKAIWPACVKLLADQEDSVKSLAIFAFNTNTGMPKYKVTKVMKDMPGPKKYTVLCTWNMFFLEGEGESRGEAEQEAAHKMMNKVRVVCQMTEIERTRRSNESDDSSADINENTQGDLTDRMRGVMVKHSSLLVDPTLRAVVKVLETFSSKVGSPAPIYSVIENSSAAKLSSTVEVICKWVSLSTRGKGSSKVMAEQKAALAMIKKINEFVKQKEYSDISSDEPIQYLVYPGQGCVRGQTSVTISSRDYLCLEAEQFLNDVIIDFYLKYLQAGLFSNNPVMAKTYTFSIYFYNRLIMNTSSKMVMSKAEKMHSNVKKWTKNVNIFDKDFIVVPINDCDHWFVIIICYPGLTCQRNEGGIVKQPLMLVLDSLEDGLKDSVCSDLRSYLTREWKEKMKTTREFTTTTMPGFCPKIPQQDNLTDCGLFLLEYVESFFKDPISSYIPPIVSLENWFSMEKVNNKRENIAKLIRDLSTKQHVENILIFPDIGFPEELSSAAKKYAAPRSVSPLHLSSSSQSSSAIKYPRKTQLEAQPIPPLAQPMKGGKREAEAQLGGGKRKQGEKEEEVQDWWSDY